MEDDANAPKEEAKLTKGQKKALKEKQKKEAAAKEAAEKELASKTTPEAKTDEAKTVEPAESKPAAADKGAGKAAAKGGKGKKGPSSVAQRILKEKAEKEKYLEEQKKFEEELRLQEEIKRKIKEEEERKIKEEQDRIEKIRIEEAKRQKELERKLEEEKVKNSLIKFGLVDVEALNKDSDAPKQKVIIKNKKKKSKKKDQEETKVIEQVKEDVKEEITEVEEKEQHKDKTTRPVDTIKETSDKLKETSQNKYNVKPGQEDVVVDKQSIKEDNNDLQLDNWEDFLDDNASVEPTKESNKMIQNSNESQASNDTTKYEEEKVVKQEDIKKSTPATTSKKDKQEKTVKDSEPTSSIFERKEGESKTSKAKKSKKQKKKDEEDDSEEQLRCPIIWVLGHVDTGKTLLLDKIRKTNVQRGEAGGITQQIGATYFPQEALQTNVDRLKDFEIKDVKIPGLLVIDTPGHESFTNLRSRGSNLWDLAILVVDIMHGLENQTLESIDLLKKRKTPFVIALNKIDVIHSWKKEEFRSCKVALETQEPTVIDEYEMRRDKAFLQINELGLNVVEYWKNDDPNTYISAIPTSAKTGEGIPDILGVIVKYTQKFMRKKIIQDKTIFQCTVLEVKKIKGIGTTIDVVLVNGKLSEGDIIVVAGFNGPIITRIRALLTPQPMKEMRVKGEYINHKFLYGAMGIKISAPELDHALAGGELLKAEDEEHAQELGEEITESMFNFVEKYVNPKSPGVCVQASTLGSLEALLEFLKTSKIPVCSVNIGPIFKKDVMKALKSLVGEKVKKEYATLLAFDVEVDEEARQFAQEEGIKIFEADIIYHLFDMFTEYVKNCKAERKGVKSKAVYPCVLKIIDKNHIFHNSNPILIGANVEAGILRIGTPLWAFDKDKLKIGKVSGIKKDDKDVEIARKGDGAVSVKIDNDKSVVAFKNFDESNQLVSIIDRDSIDDLKEKFKEGLAGKLYLLNYV